MTSSNEILMKRYKTQWWARRLFNYFTGIFVCLFLVLSVARIFNVNLVNWPAAAQFIAQKYGEILVWCGKLIITAISSVPVVVFDLITAYLLIGDLMRLSIIDIGMRSEKSFYDRKPTDMDDEWWKGGVATAKRATREEARKYRLFWFIRLASDIKGRFWTLTPIRILIYLAFVAALFVAAVLLYDAPR